MFSIPNLFVSNIYEDKMENPITSSIYILGNLYDSTTIETEERKNFR